MYKDQLDRSVEIPCPPTSIVSLVPSQTELLFDLGLDAEVTGITKFCIHPLHWFRNKTRIGGTKTVKMGAVTSLKPDLIIANKEENLREQIGELEQIAPVWVSDIHNLDQACEMITGIGEIVNKKAEADAIVQSVRSGFSQLAGTTKKKYRAAYLIWKDPYMCAGSDTFIHDLMKLCGFENTIHESRYPSITIELLQQRKPELLLLSSEPYPFRQKHIDALQRELPSTKIILVDGEMFSWYGSRLVKAAGYFGELLKGIE